MYSKIYFTPLFCLLTSVAWSQELKLPTDSIVDPNPSTQALAQEQFNRSLRFQDKFFNSPALKKYQRSLNYTTVFAQVNTGKQDYYFQQEGAGIDDFSIQTKSFRQFDASKVTVWGDAAYHSQKIKKQNFSENLDYDKIYPYSVSDTVGGDLTNELYTFSGGIAKTFGAFEHGLYATYEAQQGYRKIDPRPINTTSKINLTLASSYAVSPKYRVALSLNGEKYNQSSTITFVSKLGNALVYHDNGFGNYNLLLAEIASATYNSYLYGGTIDFAAVDKNGFFAKGRLQKTAMDKMIKGISFPASTISQLEWGIDVGYAKQFAHSSLQVKASGVNIDRDGTESLFNNISSELSFDLIGSNQTYRHDVQRYTGEILFSKNEKTFSWNLVAAAGYNLSDEYYLSPERLQKFEQIEMNLSGQILVPLQSGLISANMAFSTKNNYKIFSKFEDLKPDAGVSKMLVDNFNYLTMNTQKYEAIVRYDFKTGHHLNTFVSVAGSHVTQLKQNYFTISTGILF